MPSAITTRHPKCPACGYDLSATVEVRHRICPECGEPFELGDLMYEPRPDDWTLARGLLVAARPLTWKVPIAVTLTAMCALIVDQLTAWSTGRFDGFISLLLLMGLLMLQIGAGYAIGAFIASGMIDRAGTESMAVTAMGLASTLVSIEAGIVLAAFMAPLQSVAGGTLLLLIGAAGALAVVKRTLFDVM